MIQLWLNTLSLTIDSDRILTFDSPHNLGVGISYSVAGVPMAKGVRHENKLLWQGVSVLLTQEQFNTLQLLRSRADSLRRSQSPFGLGFYNTLFPFTEDAPRTRAIAPQTSESNNSNGSVTYFPLYSVWIENLSSSIVGEWRQTSFDLIELEKVFP